MTPLAAKSPRVVVLSGGVGGAKFAAGLNAMLPAGQLAVIVNTADDFDHLGLRICPDLDSVLYGLAHLQDEIRGWGRRDESWNCLQALTAIGAEDWFALGDRDLAVHVFRSHMLRQGMSLAEITEHLVKALGVQNAIIPMSESRVSTVLSTDEGELALQDYFVRRRCQPKVRSLRYDGAQQARLHPKAKTVLNAPEIQAIFIAPSNPFLSIDPILSLPGVKDMLQNRRVPVIAVSPLIGGRSLKGPLSDMLESMGFEGSNATIAKHYSGLIDGMVIDSSDGQDIDELDLPTLVVPIFMPDAPSRERLAQATLEFVQVFSRV